MIAGSYCIVWRDNMQYILVCEKVKKGTKKHKLVKIVSTFHRGDSLTKCTRDQYNSSETIVFYGPSHYTNFGRGGTDLKDETQKMFPIAQRRCMMEPMKCVAHYEDVAHDNAFRCYRFFHSPRIADKRATGSGKYAFISRGIRQGFDAYFAAGPTMSESASKGHTGDALTGLVHGSNLSNRYSRHHLTRFTNSKNEQMGKPEIELLTYGSKRCRPLCCMSPANIYLVP